MTSRYRIDPALGHFTVQAFATGMLAMLGHSPTFAVRDFSGVVRFDGEEAGGLGVELTVRAESIELLDRVSHADRGEIEGRMRREVLETSAFPGITFHTVEAGADPVGPDRYRVFLGGMLTLRGVTKPQGVDAELLVEPGGLRLRGEGSLRMSAYGIRPVTALGGAIRLKDELKLSFDLVALPEGS
jgi:polyisoprenoid-binding protein YceI